MDFITNANSYLLNSQYHYPLVIEPAVKNIDPFAWAHENRIVIEKVLLKHGAVLLRNFNIQSISEFNRIVQILCPNLLEYIYRSTPRSKLGGKIYTATEYPSHRSIPLHNENSYSKSWPKKIIFFSSIVAQEGGETPIADSRKIYQKIDNTIKEKFERYGVMYVRNYSQNIDLSWQEVFQTDNKYNVEKFCQESGIDLTWHNYGTLELTTQQTCQAVTKHPITGETVWFNQAHLFHISSLDQDARKSLISTLGENHLPRNVFYGNNSPIELEALEHIREIYNQEKIKFPWKKNDIMILDNVLIAHGRESFRGERKIAVAMS